MLPRRLRVCWCGPEVLPQDDELKALDAQTSEPYQRPAILRGRASERPPTPQRSLLHDRRVRLLSKRNGGTGERLPTTELLASKPKDRTQTDVMIRQAVQSVHYKLTPYALHRRLYFRPDAAFTVIVS